MKWNIDSDRPIYKQLIEQIEFRIVSGLYKPGDKLLSVRELAMEAGVNPNTMQKALAELERAGLVYSKRTSGRFITEEVEVIEEIKISMAKEEIERFFSKMKLLGYAKEEIISLIDSDEERGRQNEDHTQSNRTL
ncbi:GntR family transcriptional regulator [Eubacteriaceae bacterium ES3]|nr:GntR family transcriptional regulator [Eubacteriaceae bacterium ES3]